MDAGFAQNATDRNLRAWLSAGPVDRSVGDGLTFVASATSAQQGKGSWILRFRFGGRQREKVLGRYPDLSLKGARALARQDRALLQQGTDVAAAKQLDKLKASDIHTVENLSEAWYARHILGSHKHPEVVERVLRRHIKPVIGNLPVKEIRPVHVDRVLTKIVDAGAPTVANDALRYPVRMFHFAVKRRLIETNPAFGFDNSDAGGAESSRVRWLKKEELAALARAMKSTPNFGRPNELAVWLLLALCVSRSGACARCLACDCHRQCLKTRRCQCQDPCPLGLRLRCMPRVAKPQRRSSTPTPATHCSQPRRPHETRRHQLLGQRGQDHGGSPSAGPSHSWLPGRGGREHQCRRRSVGKNTP